MPTLIQPLRPYIPFTEKNGTLTKEGYDFLFNMYRRVGGTLSDLNAATLADKTWEEPGTIGFLIPNTGKFSTLTASTLVVTGGVSQSGGLKHGRVTTGSVGASTSALITHVWPTPFPDANYTVVASVVNSTASVASLRIVHIESVSAAQVAVRVENTSGSPLTGTLNFIAMHD